MESGKCLWVNNLFIALVSLLIISCNKKPNNKSIEETDSLKSVSSISFENGDLIYRHGNGAFSEFFIKTNKREQLYSHGGIILKSADSIYVIHSEANEVTGIGGVKKESLSIFLNEISTWGVYRIDTTQNVRDSVVNNALYYLEKETPFDFDFNSSNDESVYCTELLSLCINKAMGRNLILAKNNFARIRYFGVDDTYLEPKTTLIYQQIGKTKP